MKNGNQAVYTPSHAKNHRYREITTKYDEANAAVADSQSYSNWIKITSLANLLVIFLQIDFRDSNLYSFLSKFAHAATEV